MRKRKGIKEVEKYLSVVALFTLLWLCNGCALFGTDNKGRTAEEAMEDRCEYQSGYDFYPLTKCESYGTGAGSELSNGAITYEYMDLSEERRNNPII